MIKILKFSASWCKPCSALQTLIDTNFDKLSIEIESINIDEDSKLSGKYSVRSIPTMVKLDDGVEVDRISGVITTQKLIEFGN
jgi:thioredoxin-like negative regulator of GroEL